MTKHEQLFGKEWVKILQPFLDSEDFKNIGRQIAEIKNEGTTLYPALFDNVFNAFRQCPPNKLITVWLTTNCYLNGEGNNGIAFSAKSPYDTPPALIKIFDAVERDVCEGLYLERNNDLTRWANQGALLLNLDMTTPKGKPAEHTKLWEPFFDYLLKRIQKKPGGIIYALFGKDAWKYNDLLMPIGNDIFLLEHPMTAVKEKREWKSQHLFSRINKISNYIHNQTIQWNTN